MSKEGNITTNSIFTVQVVVIFFTGIIFCGRIFFGFFKRLLPFMPSKTKNVDANVCFDENNFDSDEEYQYEWIRQRDTESSNENNNNNNNNINNTKEDISEKRTVQTSQPATISSATSSTMAQGDASLRRKKGKYCIKIDSVHFIFEDFFFFRKI